MIGIAVLSGFITGSIAFGITYMISKPSTEIEGQNVEETAYEDKQGLSAN